MKSHRSKLLEELRADPVPTISVDQAALLLGLPRTTVYNNVRCGRIRAYRAGRRVLILTAPLLDALAIEPRGDR